MLIAAIDLLYEVILYLLQINVSFYRVIFFRYLFVVALGILLNKKEDFQNIKLISMFVFGALWLVFFYLKPSDFFVYYPWENTNLLCALYVFPIVYVLYMKFGCCKIKIRWINDTISTIGRNTYFILMVQLLWFHFADKIYSIMSMPIIFQIVINIGICSFFGCMFGLSYNFLFNGIWKRMLDN